MDVQIRLSNRKDRKALTELAAVIANFRPAYAPSVVKGLVSPEQWMFEKTLEQSWVGVINGEVIGHVGILRSIELPDGSHPPAHAEVELCRLMTSPLHQRLGVGGLLVKTVENEFDSKLWATVAPKGASHGLLAQRGWVAAQTIYFESVAAQGLVLYRPHPVTG